MDKKTAAVVYAAKSTDDPRESIRSQIEAVRKAAHDRRIVGEFSDEGFSAYRKSRGPGLAAAIDAAKAAAPCELWCFDPDRLARGDGKKARHLGGLYFELLEAGVTMRAVHGDQDLRDAIYAVLRGVRNHQDSAAKSGHVKAGVRRTVERGEWRGGNTPGGYEVLRDVDDRGRVTRRLAKHAEDAPVYDLIWRLAEEGRSAQAISLELGR